MKVSGLDPFGEGKLMNQPVRYTILIDMPDVFLSDAGSNLLNVLLKQYFNCMYFVACMFCSLAQAGACWLSICYIAG